MASSDSSSEIVPEGLASPLEEGRHPQFYNLLAKIDDRAVAFPSPKNQFRESK